MTGWLDWEEENARSREEMGKCKLQQMWLAKKEFRVWQQPVDGQDGERFCSVCLKNKKTKSNCVTMGVIAVKCHMQSDSHQSPVSGIYLSSYFSLTNNITSSATNTTQHNCSCSDHRFQRSRYSQKITTHTHPLKVLLSCFRIQK